MKQKITRKRITGNLSWAIMLSLVTAIIWTIASCGGSDSSSNAPVITTGVVTGFGSVFVNGVEFQTDAATHRRHRDDGPGDAGSNDQQVFSQGMVVSVQHREGSNKASKIEFVNNLEGPVANLTATGCTVMGVPVTISPTTVKTGAALANGAIVEVSGVPDATGAIPATFISAQPAGAKNVFQIKGIVSNLDTVGKTCKIAATPGAANAVTVNFATAVLDANIAGGLANGMFVEVKTDLAGSATSPITATKVEAGLKAEVEVEIEIEHDAASGGHT